MKRKKQVMGGLTPLVLIGVTVACGVSESDSVAPIDVSKSSSQSKPQVNESEDNSLGFKFSKGTGVGAQTHFTAYLSKRDPEHWEYAKQDGTPMLYEPAGVNISLSAFRHADFSGSKQKCSGILYNEPLSNGKYNIYYLTAKHCLYEVTPLGDRKNTATTAQLTSYRSTSKIDGVAGEAEAAFNRHFWPVSNFVSMYVKFYNKTNIIEDVFTTGAEVYESSDIIRIPLKKDVVSAEDSLPLCQSTDTPADKVFGSGKDTSIRLVLAYDTDNKRLGLQRLNGNHNLDDIKNGEYRSTSSFSDIKGYVFTSMTFGDKVTYYGYKNSFSSGAEASDSGAPVLYGLQKPPNSLVSENLISKFKNGADKYSVNWKVDSIQCVSGVISRIITRPMFEAYDSRKGSDWKWIVDNQVKTVGQETIMVTQEITASGRWSKLQ